MSLDNIQRKVDQMGGAWEEFKHINNRRLKEIEKKGSADAVTTEHLNKINGALDEYKSKIDMIETSLNRPAFGYVKENANNRLISEHKEAFVNYVRKGVEGSLAGLETKALSAGTDADGGYLITPQMSTILSKAIFETSPLRKIASVINITSESLEIIEDNEEAGANWAASETASVTDSTTPQISKSSITAHELVAQPKATQKLIDDASIDVEKWLTEKLVEVFSRKENSAFISGNGSGKPKGILAYAAGTASGQVEQINSGVSASVTADSLVKLYYALKDEYAINATFLMNRATVAAVRLLKDTSTNQYIWQPGLALGNPDTLMGVPVMMASDMPVPAASALAVAVGDFRRAYQIVDRTGVRILRDPYTEKPFVKFYTTKRVGGAVINGDALKLLKLAV